MLIQTNRGLSTFEHTASDGCGDQNQEKYVRFIADSFKEHDASAFDKDLWAQSAGYVPAKPQLFVLTFHRRGVGYKPDGQAKGHETGGHAQSERADKPEPVEDQPKGRLSDGGSDDYGRDGQPEPDRADVDVRVVGEEGEHSEQHHVRATGGHERGYLEAGGRSR